MTSKNMPRFSIFLFEIGGVLFPFGGFTYAEFGCHTLTLQHVVGRQGAAPGFIHHGQAVVRERPIVYRIRPVKKPPLMSNSDGLPYTRIATIPDSDGDDAPERLTRGYLSLQPGAPRIT
jgi:hypothetical protein